MCGYVHVHSQILDYLFQADACSFLRSHLSRPQVVDRQVLHFCMSCCAHMKPALFPLIVFSAKLNTQRILTNINQY